MRIATGFLPAVLLLAGGSRRASHPVTLENPTGVAWLLVSLEFRKPLRITLVEASGATTTGIHRALVRDILHEAFRRGDAAACMQYRDQYNLALTLPPGSRAMIELTEAPGRSRAAARFALVDHQGRWVVPDWLWGRAYGTVLTYVVDTFVGGSEPECAALLARDRSGLLREKARNYYQIRRETYPDQARPVAWRGFQPKWGGGQFWCTESPWRELDADNRSTGKN